MKLSRVRLRAQFYGAFSCIAVGVLFAYALIPYMSLIGMVCILLFLVMAGCASMLMVTFTRTAMITMHRRANIIAHNDIMAYHHNGELIHLSAIHEEAKIRVKEIAPPIEVIEQPTVDDNTVIDLFNKGVSLRNIAQSTGLTYYAVQKITSSIK